MDRWFNVWDISVLHNIRCMHSQQICHCHLHDLLMQYIILNCVIIRVTIVFFVVSNNKNSNLLHDTICNTMASELLIIDSIQKHLIVDYTNSCRRDKIQ